MLLVSLKNLLLEMIDLLALSSYMLLELLDHGILLLIFRFKSDPVLIRTVSAIRALACDAEVSCMLSVVQLLLDIIRG